MSEKLSEFVSHSGEVVTYDGCFVCGEDNSSGLGIKFYWDGSQCKTEFVAEKRFSGYHKVLHGGIIATVLDEVMIKAILAHGIVAVTGEMTIRYKAPIPIGAEISCVGRVTDKSARVIHTEGEALDREGKLLVSATGKYVVVREGAFQQQLSSRLSDASE